MANLLPIKYSASLRRAGNLIHLRFPALCITRRHCSSLKESPDEYLHRSVVPTMHFQRSLPRFPVPKLQDTMRRYLAVQKPQLDDNQFGITEKHAWDFLNGVGFKLQEEFIVQDKNNKHTSYNAELLSDKHLCQRYPLFHLNSGIAVTPDPKIEYNNQLVKATNILCSTVRFVKTLRAGLLEPDVLHRNPAKSDTERFKRFIRWVPSSLSCYVANMVEAYPLDMSQYSRMFNSTRIPKRGRDELFTDDKGRHVLVMRKGNMYVFDVVDRDGNLVKPAEIQSHLKYILSEAAPVPDFPLGVLTSEHRDVWTDLRDKLEAAGNAENLRSVDSALFCLCLDDESFRDLSDFSRNMLHGDGCNRWFDKSFSVIVTKDGQAAINFEHSWGDGKAMLRFHEEVFKDTVEQPLVHPGSAAAAVDSASAVRRLDFNLDSELKDGIKKAEENYAREVSKLSIGVLDFQDGGTEWFIRRNISPDAMVQLAFQMAFLRLYGQTCYTNEICHLLYFKHGRYDYMHTATVHTKQCSQAFVCQPGRHSVGQLKAMLHDCSTHHRQLIKEVSTGHGISSLLFALDDLATSKGQTRPGLFADPAFFAFRHRNVILSSTLSGTSLQMAMFAPGNPEGLSLPYVMHGNRIVISVGSYQCYNNQEFVQSINKSLKDIFAVLEGKTLN
ncbi:carnitine O-palmitoyltransferase 2, mitochondrial-like [Nelusetta ayraudi]|uniref:carnitine O-palmitoyltransferase 2, mitochondrial-like n=1 Tax=Nelusetta ayraudi TaxID=303726 RepID=UPI003F6EB2C6